jgi:hypothetical protein
VASGTIQQSPHRVWISDQESTVMAMVFLKVQFILTALFGMFITM